jgi:hypothetical protein
MQAQLTGQDFEITTDSPRVQAISYKEPTEWSWDITPTEGGNKKLHLTISALLNVEGETTPRTIESFERTIPVNVTWSQRLAGFVSANLAWLGPSILVPAALWVWLWVWRSRMKRLEQQRPAPPPSQNGQS